MLLKSTLPNSLAEWIESEAQGSRDKDKLLRVALYMYRKYLWERLPFEEPIEISVEHWRGAIGTHYLPYLKRFKAAGIIQPVRRPDGREYYSPPPDGSDGDRLGHCKRYFFNPQAIFTEAAIVEYNERAKKQFSGEYTVRESVKLLSKIRLAISSDKIPSFVRELVTPEYIRERLKIGEEIPEGFYFYSFIGPGGQVTPKKPRRKESPRSREFLLEIASRNGAELMLYRERCYIGESRAFIRRRVEQTRAAYTEALIRLKEIRKRPNITCSRNATNSRLDTNLTNIKSGLLGLVRLDGERLVSIDLSNSQFTILAHLIELGLKYWAHLEEKHFSENHKVSREIAAARAGLAPYELVKDINIFKETISHITVTHFLSKSTDKSLTTASLPSDLNEFINLTKNGQFYEKLAELMSADEKKAVTRGEAKKAMFLTAFSAHRYNPRPKQLLAEHYPSLVLFMNEFKKAMIGFYEGDGIDQGEARKQGNASLAVMLQAIESRIFIDGILTKLLRAGYRVFTKHDSVLCRESDSKAVEAIVRSELDAYLGAGNYRLKTERFD